MNLEEIISKSRKLVNKLKDENNPYLTKEDYFMLCTSIFVAKKESVMKKNNKTSTLHFDYKEHQREYELMDILFDRMLMENQHVTVDIPGLGEFDLTKTGCFDGIENLRFPFNLKIEVENFNGTLNELNEVKRIMWIYSKIRDSFVHGEKFRFDIQNNKINIHNELSNEDMGAFEFIVSFPPEFLATLGGQKATIENSIYYGNMNASTYKRFKEITSQQLEKSQNIIDELLKEIEDISNTEELKLITTILRLYEKAYPKLTKEQKEEYLEQIVGIIVTFAGRSRENNEKSRKIMKILSEILSIEDNDYHSVLYTHMLFVFANSNNIKSESIKTTYFEVEDDIYQRILNNEIIRTNKALNNLLNTYIDPAHTRDVIVARINKIIKIMEMRNKEIINSLRNGITHKNINVKDNAIEIFDRQDNTDENSKISFKCKTTFEKMDKFLLEIETKKENEESLNIKDFLNEIRMICGDGEHIDMFCLYINTFASFFENKEQQENSKENEELLNI